MVQSFDVRALRIVHQKWPEEKTTFSVWGKDTKMIAQDYIDSLGFKPDIFSPNYHWCSAEKIEDFHDKEIQVIPWIPNTVEEMQKLKDMGADGEITDYPNHYAELK